MDISKTDYIRVVQRQRNPLGWMEQCYTANGTHWQHGNAQHWTQEQLLETDVTAIAAECPIVAGFDQQRWIAHRIAIAIESTPSPNPNPLQ